MLFLFGGKRNVGSNNMEILEIVITSLRENITVNEFAFKTATDVTIFNNYIFEYFLTELYFSSECLENTDTGIRLFNVNNLNKVPEYVNIFYDHLKTKNYKFGATHILEATMQHPLDTIYYNKLTVGQALDGIYLFFMDLKYNTIFTKDNQSVTFFDVLNPLNKADLEEKIELCGEILKKNDEINSTNEILILKEEEIDFCGEILKKNNEILNSTNEILILKEKKIPITKIKRSFFQWFCDTIFGNNTSNAKNENKISELTDSSSSDNNHHKSKGLSKKTLIGIGLVVIIGTYAYLSYRENN